jgi:uncharacterized protein (DUF362 family)
VTAPRVLRYMAKVFMQGISKDATAEQLTAVVREVFLKASDNLSWLSEGDTVLLKPAMNSRDPFPATTHPVAVHAVHDLLAAHGARVIIGDQSGVEAVVQDPSGVVKGRSDEIFKASGMRGGRDLPFVGFEQEGWTDGYIHFRSPKAVSWPDGFFVTRWVDTADHIVSLPRLSTHSQAGVTLGFKNWVGILRDDSRVEFHAEGPFYTFVKNAVKDADLKTDYTNHDRFFERITEIALAVIEKLRATLFVGTKAHVTFGPNTYAVHNSYGGIAHAHIVTPEPGLVFASADPVAAEVVALAFLTRMNADLSLFDTASWKAVLFLNGQAQELGEQSVWSNPFVAHALRLGLGERRIETFHSDVPAVLREDIDRHVMATVSPIP